MKKKEAFMKKLRYLKILLLLSWSFFLLFHTYQVIKADADSTNSNFEKALRTTPKGLNWDNDAFKIADFEKAYQNRKAAGTNLGNPSSANTINSSRINNAKIIQSTNPQTPNTSVIQMTNDNYQTGAVWSNTEKENYFDMNHEQTASMWIYFGTIPVKHILDNYTQVVKTLNSKPADGMAFVLHNDPNGENAISLSSDGVPVNGQSLGVWGADWYKKNTSASKVVLNAIQKSWALEFDTFANIETDSSKEEGVSFDDSIKNIEGASQHIAGNYPGENSTYVSAGYPDYNYFQMKHINPKLFNPYDTNNSQQLVDDNWHHITIKWTPIKDTVTGNLTYSYDDKDPDTGKKKATAYKAKFLIDTTKLGLKGTLGSKENDDKKLYWGFTGSTGINSENNLLVFESIPSYVDVEANSSVYDYSQDPNGIQITDSNNKVDSNSEIKYKFSLKYKGWTRTWDNIKASMKIPDHVKFTSGTVTYSNSPTNQKPQPITPDVFQNIQDNKLQFQLPESLNPESRNAVMELTGRVDQTGSTELSVPSVHADFEGNNLITGTDTQPFTIKPRHLTLSSDMPNPITVDQEKDAPITGQAAYDSKNINYKNLVIHQVLNGKDTIVNSKADISGKFSYNIEHKELSEINSLDLYVTYNDNGTEFTSNHIYRQISIGGLLKINASKFVNFQNVYGTLGERIIPRLDDWRIDITDSRKKGNSWKLFATVTKALKDKNENKLDANIIYKDSKDEPHLLNEPYPISENIKDSDEPQTKHVTDDWNSSTGILLKLNKHIEPGTYTAELSWTLYDSI